MKKVVHPQQHLPQLLSLHCTCGDSVLKVALSTSSGARATYENTRLVIFDYLKFQLSLQIRVICEILF